MKIRKREIQREKCGKIQRKKIHTYLKGKIHRSSEDKKLYENKKQNQKIQMKNIAGEFKGEKYAGIQRDFSSIFSPFFS